jgi:hypothetical protein
MSTKTIILNEEDVPGAKLPRESVEQCTVVQLKRWLLCRGAKTSGVKAVLIERYLLNVFTFVKAFAARV